MKLTGVSEKVFLDRYALKDKKGNPIEKTPEEMWRRVAKAVASQEKDKKLQKKWEKEFYEAMKDFKYVPGGRILAGAGTGYTVTFYNCFVIPSPKDSREGILETLKQMVEIMARGGGVGINLSSLRPRGARVKKVNGFSSGPVNWAELFSTATKDIIQQGGCFTGNARIATDRGLVRIKEIVEGKGHYFAATHKGFKRISAKFKNGVKEVFEVKTKAGYKVKLTAEHKLLTFDMRGRFYLKPLKEFKEGDWIVLLPSRMPDDLPEVELNTKIPAPSKHSYGRRSIKLPKTLNKDLAFILGVYLGDGSRIKDEYAFAKGFRFAVDAKRTKDILLLKEKLEELFGVEVRLSKGDGEVAVLSVYSRELAEFFRINGFVKKSSYEVFVPEQIFRSPYSVMAAFVAGVFFADGGNRGGKGGFRISSVNRKFLEDISLILLSGLGIPSKLTVQKRRDGWKDLYTLSINGSEHMRKFFEIVKDYTTKAYDRPISKRDGAFNFPINLLPRYNYLSGIQRTVAYTNPSFSAKTLMFIENHFEALEEADKEDAEIMCRTLADRIESIKPLGKEEVFDLEVEDVHLLSGNGFYTSNSRRGALMLMLWDWHPDIEEFITVKQDLSRINGANLSVAVSDKFMEAVEKDEDWELVFPDLDDPEYDEVWDGDLEKWKSLGKKVKVYKKVKARKIWDLISGAAWRSAEPGVVFLERYNKLYNNWYWNKIICVNPCGEEGLPAWGVCNLGSINLSALVKGDGVERKGRFDWKTLRKLVRVATRFQDNVVDMDPYVFEGIRKTQLEGERRIGLGTMGLGDALIKLHLRYGSKESLKFIEKVYRIIRDEAYKTSAELAKEKGSFPKFDAKLYLKGKFVKQLPKEIREKIKKYGIRNSLLLMQAPTGSTSLMAGTTSGIEPVFEFEFIRKDRLGTHTIRHHLWEKWLKKHEKEYKEGKIKKPEWFVSASELTPEDHVRVQAAIQKYVDASISKTVNAPESYTVEDVRKLYTLAYKLGCKGITFYREGSRPGVLERKKEKKEEKKEKKIPLVKPRPMVVQGATYRINTPVGVAFITINTNGGNPPEPLEVFINVGKAGSDVYAMAEGLGRMISLALRFSSNLSPLERVKEIVDQLRDIGGARSLGFGENRIRSLPDAVAKVLSMHYGLNGNGKKKDSSTPKLVSQQVQQPLLEQKENVLFDICPVCGEATLANEEGCKKCYNCGYSEC